MDGVVIRTFRPSDLPDMIRACTQTAWNHLNPSEQALISPDVVAQRAQTLLTGVLAAPASLCLVAEIGGQMAAYEVILVRPEEVSGIPEALKVDGWVAPHLRGMGLNRLMHQAAEDWCRRMGVKRMACVVATHNRSSLRATDKAGFATERVIRAKWL